MLKPAATAMDVQAEERSSVVTAVQSPTLTINTYIKLAIFS
jgi:hypothetical protein